MVDCLVNGRESARISVADRGLRYGDGLFETLGCFGGRCPLWSLHLERLERGCRSLDLPAPDPEALAADRDRLTDGNPDCVLRIVWTRGAGGQGYAPSSKTEPTRVVQRLPLPADLRDQQENGIPAIRCNTRLAWQPALAGLKHLNRLEQVLAAAECARAGVPEGVIRDTSGRVIEAVTGNLLLVIDDDLITPNLDACGVRGVGLTWLMNQGAVAVDERDVDPADLDRADEILVINSVRGIRPVIRLGERTLAPGPVGLALRARWRQILGWQDG